MTAWRETTLKRACIGTVLLLFLGLTAACTGMAEQTTVADDVPVTTKPFADRPENFQFAIVGDRTGGHRPGVFRHAIQRLNQLQPEFVVGVGDLIEGYKEDRSALTRGSPRRQ